VNVYDTLRQLDNKSEQEIDNLIKNAVINNQQNVMSYKQNVINRKRMNKEFKNMHNRLYTNEEIIKKITLFNLFL